MRHEPPLLFAFDTSVPGAEACLDEAYEVFSVYRPARGFCRQCFTAEQEKQICGQHNVRAASYIVFSPIYFEHPNCSGGLNTFRHWLPRALECAVFDTSLSPLLPHQIARPGLMSWPQVEQDALRNLFSRAAVNWFATGKSAPLGQCWSNDGNNSSQDIWKAEILLSALTYLRIEPSSLANYMLAMDTPWTTLGLAAAVSPLYDADTIYPIVENADDIAAMQAAFAALLHHVRAGFHRIVTYEVLMNRWEATVARGDEKLASYLLGVMDGYDPPQLTQ